MDRFIARQMRTQRVPGLALAIVHGDEVLHVRGYGRAGGQEVTPTTRFHLASLSKGFTALAVIQLAEAGLVDLDAPVQRYLPEFTLADAEAAAGITVRHLLNQTSGLADAGFPELRLPQPTSTEGRVASLRDAVPVAPPGAEFHYFNPNYGVLARLVEVVSGQPFSAYLQNHIFTPLGMDWTVNVTTSAEVAVMAADLVQGHLLVFGVPVAAGEEQGYLGGSGGIISTADDMANYLVMQVGGGRFHGTELISPEGLELTHTPPQGVAGQYAMGWLVSDLSGRRVLEHNGILSTFYSEAVLVPESGYGFALLYDVHNVSQELLAFPAFKEGVLAILEGRQPEGARFGAGAFGVVLAVTTLLTAGLGVRGLRRLRRNAADSTVLPRWLELVRVAWAFVPAVVLVALPWLVLKTSGRAFGYVTLARSMPSVMGWLGVAALFGLVIGVGRLVGVASSATLEVTERRSDSRS